MTPGNAITGASYLIIGVCAILALWASWQIVKLLFGAFVRRIADELRKPR